MTRSTNRHPAGGADLLPLRPLTGGSDVANLLGAVIAEVTSDRQARRQPPVPVILDATGGRIPPGDSGPLREALAPLLAAACEAAASAPPRLREVVVTTIDTVSALEIEIADSGAGSPPAALAAARRPVERLGGTIACAGCPEGGLAITLRLPRYRLETKAA